MGLGHEASKKSTSIDVKNWKNLKDYNTYRWTKSMVKLYERRNGMDEDTLEIQQVIYVHRFAGRVSTYFSVLFI